MQGSFLTLSSLHLRTRGPVWHPSKKALWARSGERGNNFGQALVEYEPTVAGKGHRGAEEGEGRGAPLGEGSQAPVSGGKGLHSQVFSIFNKGLLQMCRLSVELNPAVTIPCSVSEFHLPQVLIFSSPLVTFFPVQDGNGQRRRA